MVFCYPAAMDRRTVLKHSLALGIGVLGTAGVVARYQDIKDDPSILGFDGYVMGTSYSVRCSDKNRQFSDSVLKKLPVSVHSELVAIDQSMSTWQADSELNRFNQRTDDTWFAMSQPIFSVIQTAQTISRLSTGTFDVSVGPLVDLWGFGSGLNNRIGAIHPHVGTPNTTLLKKTIDNVGFHHVSLDSSNKTIRKQKPDLQIDLSGIAKGFAVDRAAKLLEDAGFENFLVEVGGELRSRGVKPDGSDWKVAIERPVVGSSDAFRVLKLKDTAIATSGDYRNFYRLNDKRYSHSIDPRTGQPVDHELASVTVMAQDCMLADAWSTAMMVMGPDVAMAYAKKQSIAAHFILRSRSGSFTEQFSHEFGRQLA